MRIMTITTDEQRAAVIAAAQAAQLIQQHIPAADLIELGAEDGEGVRKYQLLNIWGAEGSDPGTPKNTRTFLWSDMSGEADGGGQLLADDVTRVEKMFQQAGDADTSIYGTGDLASGVWELSIPAVLKAFEDDAVARLVRHIEGLGLDENALDDVVIDVASRQASQNYNDGHGSGDDDQDHDDAHTEQEHLASEANNGGIDGQARFLIQRLGVEDAYAAVDMALDED